MSLYSIKYLFHLIFEGEKTSRELSDELGGSIYNASHAMGALHSLGLVKHPDKRLRSWKADRTKEVIITLEKLLLASHNDQVFKDLLEQSAVIHIGSQLHMNNQGLALATLMKFTGLSKVSVMRGLKKLVAVNLLRKKTGKPNYYYHSNTTLAQLFFKACREMENLLFAREKREISPQEIIEQLETEDAVLILVHYGSSARGKADELSDIDLLVVTHDKISRGEMLSRYSCKKVDLGVYSKSGFLELIKTQPDFVSNIARAKVLKGKDILQAMI